MSVTYARADAPPRRARRRTAAARIDRAVDRGAWEDLLGLVEALAMADPIARYWPCGAPELARTALRLRDTSKWPLPLPDGALFEILAAAAYAAGRADAAGLERLQPLLTQVARQCRAALARHDVPAARVWRADLDG